MFRNIRRAGHRAATVGRGHPRLAVFGLLCALILGFCVWTALTAMQIRSGLETARDEASSIQRDITSDNTEQNALEQAVRRSEAGADNAVRGARSAPWRLASSLPWVGRPFSTVAEMTEVVNDLTDNVLPHAEKAFRSLRPESIRRPDGGIDLAAVNSARVPLQTASKSADAATLKVSRINSNSRLGFIDRARAKLQSQVGEMADGLRNGSAVAELLPPMLGESRPRTYLLALQTNAEARGTGGLIGGFLILRAQDGAVSATRTVTDIEFRERQSGIDLGPQFAALYGPFASTRLWQNSNISPHFPYAAAIWRDLWRRQSGETVDGVIAADPVALQYLLPAIGDITLGNGQQITPSNVVGVTESDAYREFTGRPLARKQYLGQIAQQAFRRLAGGAGNARQIVDALARAVSEQRISVWSSDPAEQAQLASTSAGHEIPYAPGPYANVVVNNAAGSKLDYYLRRDIRYAAGVCEGSTRSTSVSVALTNAAPTAGLSAYVTGADSPGPPLRPGYNRSLVSLYSSWGAQIREVTIDGRAVGFGRGYERGHPVFYVVTELPPERTTTVRFSLTEPAAVGAPAVPDQPLARPAQIDVGVPPCSGG